MTDKPRYAFRKMGEGILVADMAIDKAALDGLAYGERVNIEIRHFRNTDKLRAWWAYLHDCIQACGLEDWTLHSLANFVKIKTGHFDVFQTPDGEVYQEPRSIAKSSAMTEAEMTELFRRTEKLLAEKFGFVNERELT